MLSMSEAFALPKLSYQPVGPENQPKEKNADFYKVAEEYGWKALHYSDTTDFLDTDAAAAPPGKLGYHGACYVKALANGKNVYAFTHKGTDPKDIRNFIADSTIALNSTPTESVVAMRFVEFCMQQQDIRPTDTFICHLGHSLGGFHAHFVGYLHGAYVCSFDNPGAWAQTAAWLRKNSPDAYTKEPAPEQAAKHRTILSIVNPVNAHGIHIGTGFFLPPKAAAVAPVAASESKFSGLEHHPFNFLIGFLKLHSYPDVFAEGLGLAEPFMPLSARRPSDNPTIPVIQYIEDAEGHLTPALHSKLTSPKSRQPILIKPGTALVHLTHWKLKPPRAVLVIERLTSFGTACVQCIQHTNPGKSHAQDALVVVDESNDHRFVQHYNPKNTLSFVVEATQVPLIDTMFQKITDDDSDEPAPFATWQGANFQTAPSRFTKLWSTWIMEQLAAVGITPETSRPLESRHLKSSAKNTARATHSGPGGGGGGAGAPAKEHSTTKKSCVLL